MDSPTGRPRGRPLSWTVCPAPKLRPGTSALALDPGPLFLDPRYQGDSVAPSSPQAAALRATRPTGWPGPRPDPLCRRRQPNTPTPPKGVPVNTVQLIGRLTRDPERRPTKENDVCTLRLAVPRRRPARSEREPPDPALGRAAPQSPARGSPTGGPSMARQRTVASDRPMVSPCCSWRSTSSGLPPRFRIILAVIP